MLAVDALDGRTWRDLTAAARPALGTKTRTPIVVFSTIACIERLCADPVQDIALPTTETGCQVARRYAEREVVVKRLRVVAVVRS